MRYLKEFVGILAITGLCLGAVPNASAADDDNAPRKGLYFGYSAGYADHEQDEDFGWMLNAMFRPSAFLGAQLAYLDFGDTSAGGVNGLYVAGVPMIPIPSTPLTLFGTVGLTVLDRSNQLGYGGGFMYDLPIDLIGWADGGLTVRVEYLHTDIKRGNVADAVLAGLTYRFGKMK